MKLPMNRSREEMLALAAKVPSELGDHIDAVKMRPSELGLWLERFVQSHTGTTGYGWDDRWKAQRARELLDYLDRTLARENDGG